MSISISLEGVANITKRLNRVSAQSQRLVSDAVVLGAVDLQNEYRRSVQKGPKTGRLYKKGNKGRYHRASAPGEAPATDSGNLASHISHRVIGRYSADVGVFGVPYAHRLEYGGRDSRGGYIAPRPALRPAAKKTMPKTIRRLEQAVRKALYVR